MEAVLFCDTPLLRVAYKQGGPADGPVALLLHGWPDDASSFDGVSRFLHELGYRTIAPWLRGCGATQFLAAETTRSGEAAALAQDALDLASALDIGRFVVIGHDWGARAAYMLAAVQPERVTRCVALSAAFVPGSSVMPPRSQARAYWHLWFMSTDRGEELIRSQGNSFARHLWETAGPSGWFDEIAFDNVARSFDAPDWADVSVHSYRVRSGAAAPDARYADLVRRQEHAERIAVPTLVINGGADRVTLAREFTGMQAHFCAEFRHCELPGVGHFPTREAAPQVGSLLRKFLG
jgi:pimeloyl-ACP methyl ester carboxylesterase